MTAPAIHLLEQGIAAFRWRLDAVDPDRWTTPTPCDGWDVHALVDHVVAGNRLALSPLDRAAGTGSRSPSAAFDETSAEVLAAFADGRPDRAVAHPAGKITLADFAIYRSADIAVHAWDLARAIGADTDLAPELVDHVLAPYVAWVERLDVPGAYARPTAPGVADSRQDRLLRRLGRSP